MISLKKVCLLVVYVEVAYARILCLLRINKSTSPTRKLTKDRNLIILKTYYTTNKTKREVEREFGVSRNTIYILQKTNIYNNNEELNTLRKLNNK